MALPFITIVSGVPRSGTSMMMQVLEAGGIKPLTDNIRTADEDNPKGYYEFEKVKKTKDDSSWLNDAEGLVVKMIYRLIYDLPLDRQYRVVFMRRDLDETLASQKKMLERGGNKGASLSDEQIANAFKKQLAQFDEWIAGKDCFSVLDVNYKEVINDPQTQCSRINEFLGGSLDIEKMAAVVDPSLYRNRK
ncbi:MAG: hypothetical protein JW912_03355 [Sedimentisphaerales bacterium]|nr:hypothetical protein [Sedimentisphaerales bacterium]